MDKKQERLKAFNLVDLYPVTDSTQSRGRSNYEVLEGIIAGGARIVQLREKEISKREYYQMALKFRKRTEESGLLLIVNDHLDVALAVGADGVHLGQDDLPLEAARDLAPELLIGVSTHNLDEAVAAQKAGADYVNIGPIFPTGTKRTGIPPRGPQAIRQVSPHLAIPFTVMGGINQENMHQVLEAGATKVAVVTAVTQAEEVALAVRALRQRILDYTSRG